MIISTRNLERKVQLAVALGLACCTTLAHAAQGGDKVVQVTQGFSTERSDELPRDPTELVETRTRRDEIVTKQKNSASNTTASLSSADHWIYDASTDLFDDFDGDGHYTYLRVRFDADSYQNPAHVYAVLYLSIDGENWEHFASTEDFEINGTSPFDDYEIETELVDGYPTGFYDVLIELYDAQTDALVDEFGPAESSVMALLPLEDVGEDAGELSIAISTGHGGGGATGYWLLSGLFAAHVLRRRKRQQDA